MRAFFYYLPGMRQRDCTQESLLARGLGHAFPSTQLTKREVLRGPDGGPGLIVAHAFGGIVEYNAAAQRWKAARALEGQEGASYWVGVVTGQEPRPVELERHPMLKGHIETLGDGQRWECPIARKFSVELIEGEECGDWDCVVPRQFDYENGHWSLSGVVARYQRLWEVASLYWDSYWNSASAENARLNLSTPDGYCSAAIECLSVNYLIGPLEASLLGLLNMETGKIILQAATDHKTWERWMKKKIQNATPAGAGSPTGAGAQD